MVIYVLRAKIMELFVITRSFNLILKMGVPFVHSLYGFENHSIPTLTNAKISKHYMTLLNRIK